MISQIILITSDKSFTIASSGTVNKSPAYKLIFLINKSSNKCMLLFNKIIPWINLCSSILV